MANNTDETAMIETLKVVFEMRKRQKQFFASKGKDREALVDSKRLEAAVDVRLASHGIK